MTEGQSFLNKCLSTPVDLIPWPHQIIDDTLTQNAVLADLNNDNL